MKIDFLINKMNGGGAERVVSLLANYFSDKNHQVRIITFTGGDKYELNRSIERIRLHKHPFFHSVVINGFFSLLNFYKKKSNRPDIMSSHINLLGLSTIPVAKLLNIKIIVSEHNNHFTKSTFPKRILWDQFYPYADAVTILTEFDEIYFKKRNKNVWIMPNPCTFKKIDNIDSVKKNEILAIGDLNRYDHKGFDNLIEIAKNVLEKHPNWYFKIVGSGDEGMEHLKELAKINNIEEKIVFTGYRTDIKELLSESSIFILPSRYEGLPMTLLEAMSQGTCSIAYDCISGPSDVINSYQNGILIDNQNKQAMVEGLIELIENPNLRNKLSKNAVNSLDKFSIENVGAKWINLLNQTTNL